MCINKAQRMTDTSFEPTEVDAILDTNTVEEEDESQETLHESIDTTHMQLKKNDPMRAKCLKALECTMNGRLDKLPVFINSLIDYLLEGIPPPTKRKEVTAHICTKASHILYAAWKHDEGEKAELKKIELKNRNSLKSFIPFALGLLSGTNIIPGLWIGILCGTFITVHPQILIRTNTIIVSLLFISSIIEYEFSNTQWLLKTATEFYIGYDLLTKRYQFIWVAIYVAGIVNSWNPSQLFICIILFFLNEANRLQRLTSFL